MKNIRSLLLITISLIAISACKVNSGTGIEGTYVTTYEQEFAKGNDTLTITVYNKDSNTYQIKRRTGYNRIREGKLMPRELKEEEWMATYNEDKMILQQTEFGRQVYVNTQTNTVSFGGLYKKIK